MMAGGSDGVGGRGLAEGYASLLAEAKAAIVGARQRAALAVNAELLELYWRLGRLIVESQRREGYGARVVERLSADLRSVFPDMRGLSPRNLRYMRAFAVAWPGEMLQRSVASLPWGHNVELLDRLDTMEERLWYAAKAVEHGWSRAVLAHQIMSKLHLRAGRAVTNFDRVLAVPQSELMQELTKDPYHLGFLGLAEEVSERTLEAALVAQVQRFLLELGQGFAFVGRQHHLDVDGEDFFVDLLFFHIPSKRYVVIELKRTEFTPEAIGKLHFYVNVVDDRLRRGGGERDDRSVAVHGPQRVGGPIHVVGDLDADGGGGLSAW